jgi:hypothetical protein
MMLAQQTFETPSVNIMAWIVLLAVANSESQGKTNKNTKISANS